MPFLNVLVLTSGGGMSDLCCTLGLRSVELEEMVARFVEEEQIEVQKDSTVYTYDDILRKSLNWQAVDYASMTNSYHVWKIVRRSDVHGQS